MPRAVRNVKIGLVELHDYNLQISTGMTGKWYLVTLIREIDVENS